MNLIEGVVASAAGRRFVESMAGRLPLDGDPHPPEGSRIIYGIRPGALERAQDPRAIEGRVELVEATGDLVEISLAVGETRLNAVFYERYPVRIGDRLSLLPKPGSVHLFDVETGARIERA